MKDVVNIIVLVSGTVDPGNMHPDKRSASYRAPNLAWWLNDPNWYWEENPAFINVLNSLRDDYTNLHIFTAHGWSGDNSATNRKIVGTYLANRLCGAGGEEAYYKGFLDQEVSFHFIGHSHGGNVINELTQRANELMPRGNSTASGSRGWPRQWKIRSITYLSTPFFTRLHQVNTGVFHEDCRIINVYNEYDLTQRVVADFSLSPMHEVLRQSGASDLKNQLAGIHFDANVLQALTSTDVDWDDIWNPTLVMKTHQGRKLYDACIDLLSKLQGILKKVSDIVSKLNEGISFPAPIKTPGKKTDEKRQMMSIPLAIKTQTEIVKLHARLAVISKAFKERRAKDNYPISGFFEDLHAAEFLQSLITFLWVSPDDLKGPFWDIVYEFLLEQIEKFDDTSNTPVAQLAKTAFANRIDLVNVTREDPYYQFNRAAAFKSFIEHLEKAEARYMKIDAKKDPAGKKLSMMDILFTLLAQMETLRAAVSEWQSTVKTTQKVMRGLLAYAAYKKEVSPNLLLIGQLITLVNNYVEIFHARNFGQLEVVEFPGSFKFPSVQAPKSKPIKIPEAAPQSTTLVPLYYGDLDYFMRVSHSVSRQALYDDVLTYLRKQINSQERSQPGLKKVK